MEKQKTDPAQELKDLYTDLGAIHYQFELYNAQIVQLKKKQQELYKAISDVHNQANNLNNNNLETLDKNGK